MKTLLLGVLLVFCAKSPTLPAAAIYTGQLESSGFIQLEVYPDRTAIFRRVVTLHLPPAELETVRVKLVQKKNGLCLEPAPRSVAPCLRRVKAGQFALYFQETRREIVLQKTGDVGSRSAPPAVPISSGGGRQ